jgi:hypothetical protein
VSDGSEVSNGVANVFGGKFLILKRLNGFGFPGQVSILSFWEIF